MSVMDEIGPSAMPRCRVYRDARELQALAAMAVELSTQGPRADVPRAMKMLDRMRAILGPGARSDRAE